MTAPVQERIAPVPKPYILRRDEQLAELRAWTPKSKLGIFTLAQVIPHLPLDVALELKDRLMRTTIAEAALRLRHFGVDGKLIEDYGLVCERVVTTAGVNFIVDAFQNSVEVETMKYHGIGTGTNAEAVGDTGLQTELTTQYSTDNTRATGSQTENSANVYRTVGTNQVDASVAITEHGIFTQAATGGGTLLDRSVFSAVNLTSGESLESTYDITFTAGS